MDKGELVVDQIGQLFGVDFHFIDLFEVGGLEKVLVLPFLGYEDVVCLVLGGEVEKELFEHVDFVEVELGHGDVFGVFFVDLLELGGLVLDEVGVAEEDGGRAVGAGVGFVGGRFVGCGGGMGEGDAENVGFGGRVDVFDDETPLKPLFHDLPEPNPTIPLRLRLNLHFQMNAIHHSFEIEHHWLLLLNLYVIRNLRRLQKNPVLLGPSPAPELLRAENRLVDYEKKNARWLFLHV